MMLQIPVNGGQKGGRLDVYSSGKTSNMVFEREGSDQMFSLAVFYSDCHIEMQPVEEGFMVTLEFNLMSSSFVYRWAHLH